MNKEDYDYINSPKHYNILGDIEVFDAVQRTLTKEEWVGFLKGNIMKYRLRLGLKPNEPVEKDLAKSRVYEDKLKKLMNEDL